MTEFKVGDRVRIIPVGGCQTTHDGEFGTLVGIDDDEAPYFVQIDGSPENHLTDLIPCNQPGIWFGLDRVEHVPPTPTGTPWELVKRKLVTDANFSVDKSKKNLTRRKLSL